MHAVTGRGVVSSVNHPAGAAAAEPLPVREIGPNLFAPNTQLAYQNRNRSVLSLEFQLSAFICVQFKSIKETSNCV